MRGRFVASHIFVRATEENICTNSFSLYFFFQQVINSICTKSYAHKFYIHIPFSKLMIVAHNTRSHFLRCDREI